MKQKQKIELLTPKLMNFFQIGLYCGRHWIGHDHNKSIAEASVFIEHRKSPMKGYGIVKLDVGVHHDPRLCTSIPMIGLEKKCSDNGFVLLNAYFQDGKFFMAINYLGTVFHLNFI